MSQFFDQNTHRRYLMMLLMGIIKAVPEKIAFKGGTCAAMFYNLPRFSFDLDFDILQPFEKRDIDAVKEILENNGTVLDFRDKLYTLFFLFDYGKGHPKIKVEFNKRVWKNNSYKNEWFMGMPLVIPDESTLITNKIVALTNRKAAVARDLFDVWYFLGKEFAINEKLVRERTQKSVDEYYKFLIKFIEKSFTRRNILQGLGEALDDKQKVWVREHLIKEVVIGLENLLHLKK